jgi:hypothetical protein
VSHVTTADVTALENGICSDIPEPYISMAGSNYKSETHNHGLAKLRIRSVMYVNFECRNWKFRHCTFEMVL